MTGIDYTVNGAIVIVGIAYLITAILIVINLWGGGHK